MELNNLRQGIRDITTADFSGVICVYIDKNSSIIEAFGLAYRPDAIPNKPYTRFSIASGTKGFTATAIMTLIQEGQLSLDTKLFDILPDTFPNFAPEITISHLLSHTSGVPDYFDEETMDDYEALWAQRPVYSMTQPDDFLPMFAHGHMKYTPGKRFSYSNSGYIILGLVIQKITGISYIEYVKKNVFKPAGMKYADFFRADMLPANTATGYIKDDTGNWRSNIYSIPVVGAPDGGAYVTAEDMCAFWTALLSNKLLSKSLTKDMFEPLMQTNDSGDPKYGYGFWITDTWEQGLTYYLVGQDPGVSFISAYCSEISIQYTILSNTGDGVWPIHTRLRQLISGSRNFT